MNKKRSKIPFPSNDDLISGYLKKIWEKGWLDNYSEDHFLIKSINNKLDDISWKDQLINNNSHSFYSPVSVAQKIDYKCFSSNFITNFSNRLDSLSYFFGEENMEKFIKNQLSAGNQKYDENQFFQALSEIEILAFYAARAKWDNVVYEPPTGENNSNPEASFEIYNADSKNIKINIEVKTPKFLNPIRTNTPLVIPNVLLTDNGRTSMRQLCSEFGFAYKDPRLTKLVDFINSAAKKFQIPDDNEYNLLYINWSYSDFPSNSFLEPWILLTNEYNGIMTHPKIGQNLKLRNPICPEAYEKISAIIVYTSSIDQLMFTNFLHVWQGTVPAVMQRFRVLLLDRNINKTDLFRITHMNPSEIETKRFYCMCSHNEINNDFKEFKKRMIHIIETEKLTEGDFSTD